MWQTPQRPQCALTYTPVRSAVNKINFWKSRRKRQRPHKCWAYLCKTFTDCVDIEIHKCFMQPVGAEESSNALGLPVKRPCRSRAPRRASHALGLLDRNVSSGSYRRIGRSEPSQVTALFRVRGLRVHKERARTCPHPHLCYGWGSHIFSFTPPFLWS